jgi:L-ectoine synthase
MWTSGGRAELDGAARGKGPELAIMIIKSREELTGSGREVAWGNGISMRFLVESDGCPFTITHTTVDAGSESHLCYERHLEACYCIEGEGEVAGEGGVVSQLRPGVLYSPARGEPHHLRARSELHLVCVFSPALEGSECHSLGADGYSSY